MGRTEDEVRALVLSVQEHFKFKQLAVYSIDTFTKVLAPPNPRWREYIDVAIDIHAASTVIKVIKQHPGDEYVLAATTKCLSRLAVDGRNAAIIGEEGGVEAVLESMAANESLPEEVTIYSLSLIDKMCNHASSLEKGNSLVTSSMMNNVTRVMAQFQSSTSMVIPEMCSRILEKLTRARPGMETLMACEYVDGGWSKIAMGTLSALVIRKAEIEAKRLSAADAATVMNLSEVFLRMLPVAELDLAAKMRDLDATNLFLDVLALNGDDEANEMSRLVAKLLAKVMDGGIADLIQQLGSDSGGRTEQQQERLLELLSALAVDGDLSDEISRNNGVSTLIGAFNLSNSLKAQEEIVKMIAKLATNAKNMQDIITSGAVAKLLEVLKSANCPSELKPQIVATLNAISRQARTVQHVASVPGGVDAIVAAIKADPTSAALARNGLEFLEALADSGDGLADDLELKKSAVEAIMAAMEAQPNELGVQRNGTAALLVLLGKKNSATVDLAVKKKVVALVLKSLKAFPTDALLVEFSLCLLALLVKDDVDLRQQDLLSINSSSLSPLEVIVTGVCAHPMSSKVREAAVRLVGYLSSEELVAEKVADLKNLGFDTQVGRKTMVVAISPDLGDSVPLIAMTLGVLAMVPENLPRLAKHDAAGSMVKVLAAVAALSKQELLVKLTTTAEVLLAVVCSALAEMPIDSFVRLEVTVAAGVAVVNAAARYKPAFATAVSAALRLTAHCAVTTVHLKSATPESDEEGEGGGGEGFVTGVCVKAGAVEACSKACDSYAILESPEVASEAMRVLYALARDPLRLGEKNGGKPCIAHLTKVFEVVEAASSSTSGALLSSLKPSVVCALKVMERVAASSKDHALTMTKQGAVDVVFQVMGKFANNDSEFVAQCFRTLRLLLSETAARAMLDALRGRDLAKIAEGDAREMKLANMDVSKLGLLGLCGGAFAEVVQDCGGPALLAGVLRAAVKCPPSIGGRPRANLVKSSIAAIGRFAKTGLRLDPQSSDEGGAADDLVSMLNGELRANPSADVVKAVAALVGGDPSVCKALVDGDCVSLLVPLLEDEQLREPGFACLAALAKQSEVAAQQMIAKESVFPALRKFLAGADGSLKKKQAPWSSSPTPVAEGDDTAHYSSRSPKITKKKAPQHQYNDGAVAQAMCLYTNLLVHVEPESEALTEAGTVQAVDRLLGQLGDSEVVAECPESTSAVLGFMDNLAQQSHMGSVALDMVKVTSQKLMALGDVLTDLGDVGALFDLAATLERLLLAGEEGDQAKMADALREAGCADLMVRIMNKFPTKVALAAKCAAVIALLGSGATSLDDTLTKMTELAEKISSAESSAAVQVLLLEELAAHMRLVANLVLQPGLVADQKAADAICAALRTVLGALFKLEASEAQREALEVALAILSRLMNLDDDDIEVPEDLTLFCLEPILLDEAMPEPLQAAACAALSSMATRGGPAVVKVIRQGDLVAAVTRIQRREANKGAGPHSKDNREAATAMAALLRGATFHAAELASDPQGSAALAQLLAHVSSSSSEEDPAGVLKDAVSRVGNAEGGAQALLECLVHMNHANDFAGSGNEQAARAVVAQLVVCAKTTPENAALAYKTEHVDALCASRVALKGVCLEALYVCETSMGTQQGARLCLGGGDDARGFAALLKTDLAILVKGEDDEEEEEDSELLEDGRAVFAAQTMAQASAYADEAVSKGILSAGLPKAVQLALKVPRRRANEQFVQNALCALDTLSDTIKPTEMGLTKESFRTIQTAMLAHKANPSIQEIGHSILKKLGNAFEGGAEQMLEDRLEQLGGFYEAAAATAATAAAAPAAAKDDIEQVALTAEAAALAGGGTAAAAAMAGAAAAAEAAVTAAAAKATAASAKEDEIEEVALGAELDAIIDMIDELDEENMAGVAPTAAGLLVGILQTHGRDTRFAGRAARILNAMGRDAEHLEHISGLASLEDLVGVLETCSGDAEALAATAELLANLARTDKVMAKLSTRDYVRVLNKTCRESMRTVPAVVSRCLDILGKIAFNNEEVIGYEFEFGVPTTVKTAMQVHLGDKDLLSTAVFVAAALLTEDESQKLKVCKAVAGECVEALKLYSADADFFTKTLRCLGNMSIVDECIQVMVEENLAVPVVVTGMDLHLNAPRVLKTAVELFSNFAAAEDDAIDAKVTPTMLRGGAVQAIQRVLDEHNTAKQVALLAACFDALYNMGNSALAATAITEAGLCEMTFKCMEAYDFNRSLLHRCVKLVSVLTYNPVSVKRLTELGAAAKLLDALSTHAAEEEFVVDAMLSLSNLATVQENAKLFIEKPNHLQHVFELLDVYAENGEVVKYVLITLVRIVVDDELSRCVASEGMPHVMRATAAFLDDAVVLGFIFELLGQLAFVKSNIRAIVAAGGIKVLLATMETFDNHPELIVKTMSTLDNLVSAEPEYAYVVIERDGENLLKDCIGKWRDDKAVVQAGTLALLSIQAQNAQREKGRTNRAALFARLGSVDMDSANLRTKPLRVKDVGGEPREDPLKKWREPLKSGFVTTQWLKGKPLQRTFGVSADFTSLVVREVYRSNKVTKDVAHRFAVKEVKHCRLGHGPDHTVKSFMGLAKPKNKANKELCYYIEGIRDNVLFCGEGRSTEDTIRLKDAVEAVLNVAHKWPHRLTG